MLQYWEYIRNMEIYDIRFEGPLKKTQTQNGIQHTRACFKDMKKIWWFSYSLRFSMSLLMHTYVQYYCFPKWKGIPQYPNCEKANCKVVCTFGGYI